MPQCGHVLSRIAYSTRWDEINCHCQCASCNMKHEHDPWPYLRWFIDKFGQEVLDDLHVRYHKPKRFLDYELEEMEKEYKRRLKNE